MKRKVSRELPNPHIPVPETSEPPVSLEKYMKASRLSERRPVSLQENLNASSLDLLNITLSREKMSKRLSENIDCKDQSSLWHLNGFPDGSAWGQQ